MRILFLFLFILCSWSPTVAGKVGRDQFFIDLASLEFDHAREQASLEKDSTLRFEMLRLADLLYYEGQKDQKHFKSITSSNTNDLSIQIVRELTAGYIILFYERDKDNAYKHFHAAYQQARNLNNSTLIKATLLAFFKYHNSEIAQVSESYKTQLDYFEELSENIVDATWLAIFKMIFYSKVPVSLGKLDNHYYESAASLDQCELKLNPNSPLLTHVYYEKAIRFMIDKDANNSERYFIKVIEQAKDLPFLKDERFNSYLKLLIIETNRKNFSRASDYLIKAKSQIDRADTLRSDYYLNLYSSLNYYSSQHKYDSAFFLLKKAYMQEFQLDFRRNTLEINRLSVELNTQEKENANLKLRQNRTWLISSLVGVALLFLASYFAYMNQRSKNKIHSKEKQVQSMRIERILKEQELLEIDAMIEGQEKERQRIANDLHDNLGSLLVTVKLHFQHLKTNRDTPDSLLYDKTDELIEEAYQKIRTIAHSRNVAMNPQEGLLPAVRRFADKVSIINKLKIYVEEHGLDKPLDSSLEISIFRITQELITNAIKHAFATEVTIHLIQHETSINLMVEDNGRGFDQSLIKPGTTMGLYSIQKRIENAGGTVTIDSILRKGTSVIIDIPLA